MPSKQVTWRKSNLWKSVGTIKSRNFRVTLTERAPLDWRLNVLNREFPFTSPEAAKAFCETPAFAQICDTLAAQWNAEPAVSTQAALEAAALGLGRGCVSAPETFVF